MRLTTDAGWTTASLARATNGECFGDVLPIGGVSTDSRQAIAPDAIFIALSGERFDGHDFLMAAHAQGARIAMVRDADQARAAGFESIVEVPDTTRALQQWAGAHRAQYTMPVIGVTGSNGKTIVKEMLASIIAREHTVYRSPGSFNSQVGVALTLLGIAPEHEVVIVEAGISQPGEMTVLEEMICPTHGVLTNIGTAHAARLRTLDVTMAEKSKLFVSCAHVIAPASDMFVSSHADYLGSSEILWFAGQEDWVADVTMRRLHHHMGTWHWKVAQGTQSFDVTLNTVARHDVANAMAAISCALVLGISSASIQAGLLAWESAPMRVEIHTTPRRITLINDAYSADPVSTRHALETLFAHALATQRKIVILGDMLDLGQMAVSAHQQLGRELAQMNVDRLYCVGALVQHVADEALAGGMPRDRVRVFGHISALQEVLDDVLEPDDVVLFKGSRAVGLERVAEALLESVGPTRLYVDLAAISRNYHALKRHVGARTRIMAVVKSYGYGNDATRISKALVREGVDALAVAYADEGIPLREAGLDLPVLVMNTLDTEADKLIRYGLTGLVYSERVANALATRAARAGVVVPVHMKINTGMNRAGLRPEQAGSFARMLSRLPSLNLTGVMTHFASADEAHQDGFTGTQLDRFEHALGLIRDAGVDPGIVHAANTSAAWRIDRARYDMVRFGLGLYGLNPSDAVGVVARETLLALKFVTHVIHVHHVNEGEGVGYGQSWRASEPRVLATIAAGYNDGFPRYMSNGGHVLIHGRRCEVVGRVCMDVSVVDVTHLKDVAVGNEVVLFGQQGSAFLHVNEMSERGRTISYEILCNISPRVRRIFVHAS